ncbi:MAG: cobyrinate a,c-diamide synthase [Phaeovulum sp.]|uniref:cobyrinate a,c-diamide synthase n=1 Tax=Phaeovulum sp. TaxID=2934796 RepID=UPI00272FC0C2|nr:cobyrinate a,c-diamide synthase [Phaeovulum sp.]MDP2062416.1 cobyrinate a,c-diamide synthase [Phaeovulum sp.]
MSTNASIYLPRVLISATRKSSGKTTLALGIAAALRARRLDVRGFKKGPDYIDPMWMARATGKACYNLDFNTQSRGEITAMLAAKGAGADLALIEGNMGLHDGVDPDGGDSSAALARLVAAPVLLVLDCTGMTRSVAALALGFAAFEPDIRIGGVILNRVAGPRQEEKLRAALERHTDLPVLGAVPRADAGSIVERHLGLTTPGDVSGPEAVLAELGRRAEQTLELDAILALAGSAPALPAPPALAAARAAGVTIAVARDAAFGFTYPDDLEALVRAGARLEFFSPLSDARLPEADAILLPGGFPETHLKALSANAPMRAAIRAAAATGVPIHAECGGLMYLTRAISFGGQRAEMAGVIAAETEVGARAQGRGLVVVEPTGAGLWTDFPGPVAAHEFHHAALVGLPANTRFAWRVRRGHGIDGVHDGIVIGNVLASFTHLRNTAACDWAARFVAFARANARENAARVAPEPRLATRERSQRMTP